MATFRHRKGKWQVQVRRRGQVTQSRTFTLKADALKWARQAEAEGERNGFHIDLTSLERLKVSNLFERFRDEVIPKRKGSEKETFMINAFLRSLVAAQRLSAPLGEQFARYRDARLATVKPATVIRELWLFHHVFETARAEWGIPLSANPLKLVRKPKADNARDRRLKAGESEKLLEAGKKTRNPLLVPLMKFALETGMRRGEILNSKWEHLNWDAKTLHIPLTKNGHARTIPLTDTAIRVLSQVREARRNEPEIFPLSIEAVKLSWARLTKRGGIVDLHFHDLRHEAVSRFFERGLSIPEVALISGHKDPRMLFRYTHLRAEDVGRKLRGLDTKKEERVPHRGSPLGFVVQN